MKKKYYVIFFLIICSLFVGCVQNENNKESNEKEKEKNVNRSQSANIKDFDDNYAIFLENEDCIIRTSKVEIIDNNAIFSVSIENKSESDIKILLDKVTLGDTLKEIEFEYIIKVNETKNGILKVKDITKLDDLNDKMEGVFKVNSKKYNFVFK